MITVKLPDGSTAQFPDGTAPDVMKKALARFKVGASPTAERIAAAKAGTLQMQPGSAERSASADAIAADQMKPQPSVIGDVLKSGAAGLARGVAGIADMPRTVVNAGFGAVDAMTGGQSPEWAKRGMTAIASGGRDLGGPSAAEDMATITGGASQYQAQTTPGEYAGTVGEFIPGAMMGGGGVKAALQMGVVPGLASEAAGQATEGTKAEPWARLVAGMAAAPAIAALGNGARAVVSPYGGADPERLKLAKVLDDFGVPITAGQRTGSVGLRKAEGATSAGERISETQADAFTKAALKTIGEDATRATPEVLDGAAKRIGAVFDDVVAGVDVTPDAPFLTKLAAANDTYKQLKATPNAAPIIRNILRVGSAAFRGKNTIPAETLKTWRSTLSNLTTDLDAATRIAARETLEAVDDALEGAIIAAGKPENVARLATARSQWRNFLAIESAASRAGEQANLGVISPARLASAVTAQGRSAMARGKRGDIGELSRAGVAVMSPLPTTTAGGVRNVPGVSAIIGGGVGGAVGSAVGSPAIGAALGMLAPAAISAAKMTGPMQRYLANQAAAPGGPILQPGMAGAVPGAATGANDAYQSLRDRYK